MPEHPLYWQKACDVLAGRDKRLASLIAAFPSSRLCRSNPSFITLAKAIVGQQIPSKPQVPFGFAWNKTGGAQRLVY